LFEITTAKKMLTLFFEFSKGFFLRRRLISVFVVLSMFTMILIDSYHVGFLERYNSLVSFHLENSKIMLAFFLNHYLSQNGKKPQINQF
jgi:hypothetical protein